MKQRTKLNPRRKVAKSKLLVAMLPPDEFFTLAAEYMARPPKARIYDFARKCTADAKPVWLYWQR